MILLILAAITARVVIPKSRAGSGGRISWLGGALLSGWLVASILTVSEAPEWGWTSPTVIGLVGVVSARYGTRSVLVAGTAIGAVPFVLLTVARAQQWEILISMGLLGIGFGLAFSAMSNLVVQAVPIEQTGVASGMNANIRTIGGVIGAAVMSSIVAAGAHPLGLPRASGYTHGFLAHPAAQTPIRERRHGARNVPQSA